MTGIDLRVAGDESSCRSTADALSTLGEGITRGVTSFYTARSESESLWSGTAGDAFRERMGPGARHADDVADHTRAAGQALHAFADDLATVKSRMNQAREIAASASLTVDGDTIEEPHAPPPTGEPALMIPEAARAQQSFQRQQYAYYQAQQAVTEARALERNAHNALEQKMNAWQTMLQDASDQKAWLIVGSGAGVVGTAITRADKWAEVAQTRSEQARIWRSVADRLKDPYGISRTAAQAGVYEQDAAKFEKLLKSDSRLAFGLRGTKVGDLLSGNLEELPKIGEKLGVIGEKIPVVGAVLAVGQTIYDSRHDKSVGEVAQYAGADLGGFLAGTAATEGTLAGAAAIGLSGGPVTLAAVGVGVGVAYGVGEVVNHWPEISHWAGHTASDIGHGVANAGHAVGHFFSGVF